MSCSRSPFSHIALSCFRTASSAEPSKPCWPQRSVFWAATLGGLGRMLQHTPSYLYPACKGHLPFTCTPPPAPSINWFLNTFSLQLVLPNDLLQDNSEWALTVSFKATPCVPPVFRRATFNGAPILFISHQNEMPLLFGETKAQEKIKHIKGSPEVL